VYDGGVPLNPHERLVIVSSDPAWPAEYARLARALGSALSQCGCTLEHVGSTAVPGLDAKPILDVAIVINASPGAAGARAGIRDALARVGYVPEGEKGVPGRESFRRTGAAVPTNAQGPWMDHHLYLVEEGGRPVTEYRLLRDLLVRKPEWAARYAMLKRSLAEAFGDDREGYTEAKTSWIVATLRACEAPAGPGPDTRTDLPQIDYAAFAAVEARVGTVVDVQELPRARTRAYVLRVDFGERGLLKSSARITDRYSPAELLGRQVVAVVNFPARQIGPVMSECLVLGADSAAGVVLLGIDRVVANGTRIY
jgi:tRNA-binding protein